MRPLFKVAFSGPAGAGKDAIATALADFNIHRLALADPMRKIFSYATGVPVTDLEAVKNGALGPEKAAGYRRIMQMLGTEVFRQNWSDSIWVDHLLRRVEKYEEQGWVEGVVVTDVRFENEFARLKAAGFCMIDIRCPVEYMRLPPGSPGYDHASERDLDAFREAGAFDTHFLNDRSKSPDLYAADVISYLCFMFDREAPPRLPKQEAEW